VLLWSGQAVSVLGTQVTQIAFPLLVLGLTGSAAAAGLVAAARTIPYLLLTLPAGALVDRWDRRAAMVVCSAGSALALASVVVAHAADALTIPQIVAVSLVEGSFAVVYGLAETAALRQVVPTAQLPTAVAQQQLQYSIGGILGPPLGGVLFGLSVALPFAVDAASNAAASASLAAVRTPLPGAPAAARSIRAEVAEGMRWLWDHPLIRYMAVLTGLLNFAGQGVTLIAVVLAKGQGASPAEIGAIFAAGGVGGVLGALIAPFVQRRLSFGRAIVGQIACTAAAILFLAVATTPLLVLTALVLLNLVSPLYDTVQQSYRMALVPERLQGRVTSVFRMVAHGLGPFGLALTGVLLDRAGGSVTALACGGLMALLALVTARNAHVRAAPSPVSAGA
jgi:MFS family permease